MVVLKGTVKEVAMLFVAVWLVLGSLAVPTQVDDRAELGQVKLRLLVYFIVQDSSSLYRYAGQPAVSLPCRPRKSTGQSDSNSVEQFSALGHTHLRSCKAFSLRNQSELQKLIVGGSKVGQALHISSVSDRLLKAQL